MANTQNIIMLGGRRAGKSTILSSILYELSERTSGNLFTVIDKTVYSSNDGIDGVAVRLRDKRNEMTQLLKKRAKIGMNANFLVDMTPTKGESTYSLQLTKNGSSVNFDFIDVPGEFMEDGKNQELKERLKKCDVYIIVIDTPYMMQDDDINKVFNRVDEITSMMTDDEICGDKYNKKLILFCPVKCEKWVREGNAQLVSNKVCKTYRDLINHWLNHGSNSIEFLVMPIQSVGGLEHARMLDGYRYYGKDDKIGKQCSKNEITGQIFLGDGTIGNEEDYPDIEEDGQLKQNGLTLPLSWYKINGAGFAPENCEQPAYHILKFLVDKHLRNLDAQKKERDRHLLNRIVDWLNGSPFAAQIDAWQSVVDEMGRTGKIKLGFDGFIQIANIID